MPRGLGRYVAGAGVLLTLGFLSYQVLSGPVHAVRDQAGCARAYAEARTRRDTLSVDFMSFPEAGRGTNRRCGMLNPAPMALPGNTLTVR